MKYSAKHQTGKRKRSRKSEYAKPFNYNIIAWVLLAVLAVFVVLVRLFW
jgi:hypothetical protein